MIEGTKTATVHLCGYELENDGEGESDSEDDSDYDDEDFDPLAGEDVRDAIMKQMMGMDENGDSEDDDSESGDDDSEDESDFEDAVALDEEKGGRRSGVKIEEISDEDAEKLKRSAAGAGTKGDTRKHARNESKTKVRQDDDDDDRSSEDDSGDDSEPIADMERSVTASASKKKRPAEAVQTPPASKKMASTPGKSQKPTPAKEGTPKQQQQQKKTPAKGSESVVSVSGDAKKQKTRRFPNGLELTDLAMGRPDGRIAKRGAKVRMKYVGKLKNGKVFDQTKGNATFEFRLGVGEVIQGWDAGVAGMREGDKRRLVVPPALGYGSRKMGPIPANSTLSFDVELVKVL